MLNAIGFTPSLHMARRRQSGDGNAGVGERAKLIRETIGETLEEMADRMNEAAEEVGLPAVYKFYTVQRMEGGAVSFEDAALLLYVAPASMKATWSWLAIGRELAKKAKPIKPTVEVRTISHRERAQGAPAGAPAGTHPHAPPGRSDKRRRAQG
jgi:transcriptional regulator with XRE-family HTH domain